MQETPDGATRFYTVSPHMQAGSMANLPLVLASIGAARGQDTQFRVRVEIVSARGYGGFERAEARQSIPLQVQALESSRDCAASPACPRRESFLVTIRGEDLKALAERNSGLRLRLVGGTGYVETAIPAGHIQALLAALAAPAGRT